MIPRRPNSPKALTNPICDKGYERKTDANDCTDVDECKLSRHACHPSSQCVNTEGSYYCTCPRGMHLSGQACEDTNECQNETHKCDKNASCANFEIKGEKGLPGFAGYTCSCNEGFVGNGYICMTEHINRNETKLGSFGSLNIVRAAKQEPIQLSSNLTPRARDVCLSAITKRKDI